MSGDVQPRKRKDKRKKKDELGIEEPRGTAAALGEGDVFIHSYSDHGTGGHWCAKVIFFSLLAILITLIGLIILENRGLTELEANSVESKYSGVLEGWIEEAPEDDHYDQHTLDLKHPEDEDDEDHLGPETDHDHEEEDEGQEIDDEHEEAEETESNEVENNEDEENEDNDDESQMSEENTDETEEVEERIPYRQYNYEEKYKQYNDVDDDDDDEEKNEDEDDKASEEVEENEDDNLSDDEDDGQNLDSDEDDDDVDNVDEDENDDDSVKYDDDDNDDEYENSEYQENDQDDSELNKNEEDSMEDDGQDDDEDEIEKIESERIDWEESAEKSYEEREQDASKADDEEDVEDFQNVDDDDEEPPIEQITTPPAGKPFVEIEEEVPVKPVDTLAEEAEYERRQEELRKQKEESQGSDMWLKLAVGGALLVATHAVLRRATARDAPAPEEQTREETPMVDRRMTLLPEDQTPIVQQTPIYASRPNIDEEVFKKPAPVVKNEPIIKPIQEEVKEKKLLLEERKPTEKVQAEEKDDEEKELYSDEEEIVEEEEEEDEEEPPPKLTPHKTPQAPQKEEESETEEVPEDVEIIDDEQIDEEIEEEEVDEDEEEISDVDDSELLNRLEAKYGRLPEPERFGKNKEGGNSIDDEWPGEPSEPYWRQQLDMAEEELRQDWLD
ncbi:unnamed protein product, partial [Brenthis ino]